MISVLLIDDHEVVRIGLRFAIESAFSGSEVAEAGSLAAGLADLRQGVGRDLVLLDPGLPDAGGVSGLQAIREAHPEWIDSNAWCPRVAAAIILSGSALQTKRFGCWLWSATNRFMAA